MEMRLWNRTQPMGKKLETRQIRQSMAAAAAPKRPWAAARRPPPPLKPGPRCCSASRPMSSCSSTRCWHFILQERCGDEEGGAAVGCCVWGGAPSTVGTRYGHATACCRGSTASTSSPCWGGCRTPSAAGCPGWWPSLLCPTPSALWTSSPTSFLSWVGLMGRSAPPCGCLDVH